MLAGLFSLLKIFELSCYVEGEYYSFPLSELHTVAGVWFYLRSSWLWYTGTWKTIVDYSHDCIGFGVAAFMIHSWHMWFTVMSPVINNLTASKITLKPQNLVRSLWEKWYFENRCFGQSSRIALYAGDIIWKSVKYWCYRTGSNSLMPWPESFIFIFIFEYYC